MNIIFSHKLYNIHHFDILLKLIVYFFEVSFFFQEHHIFNAFNK